MGFDADDETYALEAMARQATVEQVDREAAANNILKRLIFAHGGIRSWMAAAVRSVRNGEQDDYDEVQAFAAHRIQATRAKDAEIYNLKRYQDDLRRELEHARECATKAEAALEVYKGIVQSINELIMFRSDGMVLELQPILDQALRTAPTTGAAG